MGLRWDAKKEQFVEGRGKRGRPKGSRTVSADTTKALKPGELGKVIPPEIVLSEEAPIEALIVAAFKNLLNGYPINPLIESELTRRKLNVETFHGSREDWAHQAHAIIDEYDKLLANEHMDMGDYVMYDTTAGMGTVRGAMTGERDKRGKLRE
ncbi:MAG: hypothetical protein UX38_C0004G0002 [Microgenomates group bacterium GW2011_GWC1_46_16]|uniref:Uncharacterized protein n=2 Tax=Candidatus Collieribacteriota TaxID=1752725 RepID=A0A1F5G0A8_9BACT|nr:MAG: hypothetical protein UX32_C0009G0011 [Microgenomates group bacterium GW2011_GWF1_46_12]KKU26622.1 MAG: hypothetical protein UX38_C0004G0002 [Microgenomates group bacterium GW2011_GWC1_46_16]KKU28122.1 MAG: hypothetical protein UX40_C0003G0069 [Microgenomates group bacterium GW2011_GWF2_46_18]KKU42857.1 MAG: hypothetical protein UX59_C0037G0003 [Microgenomates group bacterium GW2011_GWA1_46_7]KKU45457.1 MAG: hypothetical protein UX63_C0005G0009 [Microgenomates group bacterium GW2011_GWB1